MLQEDFPDGRLLAEQITDPLYDSSVSSTVVSFIEALQGPGELIPDDEVSRHKKYSELCLIGRVLIVIDDARSQADTKGLIPESSSCAVIVTSRVSLGLTKDQLEIELSALENEHCMTLLDVMIGGNRVRDDFSAAQEIVENSEGYPLAVRLAGASLATREYSGLGRAALRLSQEKGRDQWVQRLSSPRHDVCHAYRRRAPCASLAGPFGVSGLRAVDARRSHRFRPGVSASAY